MKDGFLGVIFGLVLVALGLHALPNGLAAAIFLAGPRDEAATADYLLTHKTADDYTAAAERALAAGAGRTRHAAQCARTARARVARMQSGNIPRITSGSRVSG